MSHKPVDLLIMLGTNDTKERFSSSPTCIAGLKRLITKAINTECWPNNKPILIVTPKNIEKEYEDTEVVQTMGYGCRKSEQLGVEYEKIARLTNCHYFDANTVVKEYNKIDYMHLDEKDSISRCFSQLNSYF